ncbi:hypothetical protein LTR66_011985 [Elasticomyces elasticus]|nr:hypothetical protein LTR66_011985 [Elasticomyces elasticus]
MIRDLVGVAKESYYNEMLYMLTAFKALDALKEGIIDSLGGLHETLQYIDEMQLTRKAEKGVYGVLKEEMWRETVGYLEKWIDEQGRDREAAKLRKQDLAEAERKVVAWERGAPKAKLLHTHDMAVSRRDRDVNIERCFAAGKHTDLVIHCAGTEFKVHKLILTQYQYFVTLLEGSFKEKDADVIDLSADHHDTLHALLH